MKTYRLKPPTFDARRFSGKPDILTNGLFAWLGPTAKVVKCDASSITVSVLHYGHTRELVPGDWIVRERTSGNTNYVSKEEFERDFEVNE